MRKALKSDIPWMVSLSHNKRKSYAEAQKQFWKMAKDSDKIQTKWFEELFEQKNAIALVADNKEGFVIGGHLRIRNLKHVNKSRACK